MLKSGPNHTCYLNHNQLWCWGNNSKQQAEVPLKLQFGLRYVSLGDENTCGYKRDHQMTCWGDETQEGQHKHGVRQVVASEDQDVAASGHSVTQYERELIKNIVIEKEGEIDDNMKDVEKDSNDRLNQRKSVNESNNKEENDAQNDSHKEGSSQHRAGDAQNDSHKEGSSQHRAGEAQNDSHKEGSSQHRAGDAQNDSHKEGSSQHKAGDAQIQSGKSGQIQQNSDDIQNNSLTISGNSFDNNINSNSIDPTIQNLKTAPDFINPSKQQEFKPKKNSVPLDYLKNNHLFASNQNLSCTVTYINLSFIVKGIKPSKIFCWGDNTYGQLNINRKIFRKSLWISELELGRRHLCVLQYRESNKDLTSKSNSAKYDLNIQDKLFSSHIACWGDNSYHQSTVPFDNYFYVSNTFRITAGGQHTCRVTSKGTQCFGLNIFGQTDVPGGLERRFKVRDLSAGRQHSCALQTVLDAENLESKVGTAGQSVHNLRCWGDNEYGQLGGDWLNWNLQLVWPEGSKVGGGGRERKSAQEGRKGKGVGSSQRSRSRQAGYVCLEGDRGGRGRRGSKWDVRWVDECEEMVEDGVVDAERQNSETKRIRHKPFVFRPSRDKFHQSKQIQDKKRKPKGVLINHEKKTINIDNSDGNDTIIDKFYEEEIYKDSQGSQSLIGDDQKRPQKTRKRDEDGLQLRTSPKDDLNNTNTQEKDSNLEYSPLDDIETVIDSEIVRNSETVRDLETVIDPETVIDLETVIDSEAMPTNDQSISDPTHTCHLPSKSCDEISDKMSSIVISDQKKDVNQLIEDMANSIVNKMAQNKKQNSIDLFEKSDMMLDLDADADDTEQNLQTKTPINYEMVSTGEYFSCAATSHQVHCWGANDRKQIEVSKELRFKIQ